MTVHIEMYSEKLEFNGLGTLKGIAGHLGLNTQVGLKDFPKLEAELTGVLEDEYGLHLSNDGNVYTLTTAEGDWLEEWGDALEQLKDVLKPDCHIVMGRDDAHGVVCITPQGTISGDLTIKALADVAAGRL